MAEPELLMVLVDPNLQSTPALVRAAAIAHETGERVLLAAFEYDSRLAHAARHGSDLTAYLRGRQEKLEALAEPLRASVASVECRIYWGHPRLANLLLHILDAEPDLVFKDLHASASSARFVLSRPDLDLLRHCPAPLMLVREDSAPLPQRILAAIDPFDEHGRPPQIKTRVLEVASAVTAACGASLDVVHVLDPWPRVAAGNIATGWTADAKQAPETKRSCLALLKTLTQEFGIGEERLHVLEADPRDSRLIGMRPEERIAQYAAANNHDLVVMGTVRRPFLQRLALGSVAEGLLYSLDCDMLAVKPQDFAARLKAELDTVDLETAVVPPLTGGNRKRQEHRTP